MSAAPAGRAAGFTLLEVLVGLVILGFIVSGLAGSTRFGLMAMGTQSRIVSERQDLEPVDRLLRRLVAGMALPNDGRQAGLVGDRTGFACVTRTPAAQEPGAASRVDAFVAVNGAHQLVLRWSPHWHAERLAPRAPAAEEVLLEGIDRLDVSYLSPDRGGWLEAWNRTDLPGLIRIRLRFAPGDPRRWPPIIAATQQGRPRAQPSG